MRLKHYIDAPVRMSIGGDAYVKSPVREADAKCYGVFYITTPIVFNTKLSAGIVDSITIGGSLTGFMTILNNLGDGLVMSDGLTISNSIHRGLEDSITVGDALDVALLSKASVEDVVVMGDRLIIKCSIRRRFSDLTDATFESLKDMTLGDIDFITQ